MSDAIALTQTMVAMQSPATQQALQTEIVRQQASAEQGVVDLLRQSAEQQKAALPAGQGQFVDVTA